MQIKGVGVSTAGMIPVVRGIENRGEIQLENDMFGPECRVTISEAGRKLSEQQAVQKEKNVCDAQSDKETKILLRQLEEAELSKRTREGYYDELEELEKQIKVMNAAYGRMRDDLTYNDPLMKEVVEQQRLLREAMQEQKDFQAEESQRKLEEAQKIAAMQASQYKEEIDENNRDLVTVLKTMEEAEKAGDEQEKDALEDDSGVSNTENSASDVIHNSALGLMKSSLNHEKGVEEISNMVRDSGHWFLSQANGIAQDLLRKSTFMKGAVYDKSFTNVQVDEMMQGFRAEVKVKGEEAYILGSFGTQVLRDMRDVKIQRIADNPMKDMQQVKEGMMQAAADAALGEARNSSLDETSKELAEEVKELIDERNGIDRTPEEKKEEEREKMQEKLMHPGEEKEEQHGAII